MADETTTALPSEETTIQEPQATPETDSSTEEQEVTLPSDVDNFEIPDKFKGKSAEEIARAYVELERMKQGGVNEQGTEGETPPKPNEEAQEEQPNYFQEYLESGTLSEESLAELEKQGYKREEVIDRLEFERYRQEKAISQLVEPIGGIEEYTKLNEWAKSNIPQEELIAFAEEFKAAGPMAKAAMLKDAYSLYKQSIGESYDGMIHTNEPQSSPVKGYTTQAELQKDMSDPRYGIDRSYTQAVEEKVARSDLSKL